MENLINLIAGRPGAGKTLWACREAAHLVQDPDNVVIYIGHRDEFDRILSLTRTGEHKNLFFAHLSAAAQAIGQAIDFANAQGGMFRDMNMEIDQMHRKMVYLFYDQCRFDLFCGRRELLTVAAKAGVIVYVLCQVYAQVDKKDAVWRDTYCNCFVISKSRPPRLASPEEICGKYSGLEGE